MKMKLKDFVLSIVNFFAKPFMGSNMGYKFPLLVKIYYESLRLIGIESTKKVALKQEFELYVDTNSFIGVELLAKKTLDKETVVLFDRLLLPSSTVIDAGANFGCYTIYFAKHFGNLSRVFAIEPDEHNLALLKQNVLLNNLKNVNIIPAALGESEGRIDLQMSSDHGHTQIVEAANGHYSRLTLDALLETYNIKTVDLLKIDIEGSELAALYGASHAIKTGKIRNIYIEINPGTLSRYGVNPKDIVIYLSQSYTLTTMQGDYIDVSNINEIVAGKAYIDILGRLKTT